MKTKKELIKKLKDWRWRLNHLYSIVDKKSQKIVFKENIVQKLINDCPARHKMILKARQFGVTTNELLKMLDFVAWNRNKTGVILAHEQDAIKKLFRIPVRAYKAMHEEIRPRLAHGGSAYEMYFPKNNSRIYCDLESRGDTINWLHISEAAFIKDPAKIIATIQAVPIDTGIITMETTPNGLGNHFYEAWIDSQSHFKKLFFPWFIFPEYQIPSEGFPPFNLSDDEQELITRARQRHQVEITPEQINFRRFKIQESKTGAKKNLFFQEYPEDENSCFLSSGNPVMDLFKVQKLLNDLPHQEESGRLVFKNYEKDKTYVIGADVAEGVGGDWSVGVVIRTDTREVVAVCRGQWSPYQFAHQLDELAGLFTGGGRLAPLLGVERNNHGHAVLLELVEHIHYPNIYYHSEERPGWVTDKVTRPLMLDAFIDGIDNDTIRMNHRETLSECLTFHNIDGKPQATPGKHDDCIMATAIALQMVIEAAPLAVYTDIKNKIRL